MLIKSLLVLSIFYAIPATVLILLKLRNNYEGVFKTIPKLSSGNFYITYDQYIDQGGEIYDYDEEKNHNRIYGLVILILNFIVIIFFLLYSIKIRKYLVKKEISLDRGYVTASDFSMLAKNLPDDLTEDELK